MKIILVYTGKTQEPYIISGVALFTERLRHYLPVDVIEVTPPRSIYKLEATQVKQKEGEYLIRHLPAFDYLVLLDEAGKSLSSAGLSDFLQARMNQGIRQLVFLTGGAYGVSDQVRKISTFTLSLSPMTFTHQMARLLLTEQLYRAMTIIKREPYHNP